MKYPSRYIEDAVAEFKKLPGVGEKTALRLVLHLLRQETSRSTALAESVARMRTEIKRCAVCRNYADQELCTICSDPARDASTVCIVQTIRDFIAIESTGMFSGRYHVLGGVISPVDGIGPDELEIPSLVERVRSGEVTELILALNPTMEGDTTAFYISRQVADLDVRVSAIARGVSFGGELEYTDELTLARSIATRQPYENYLVDR